MLLHRTLQPLLIIVLLLTGCDTGKTDYDGDWSTDDFVLYLNVNEGKVTAYQAGTNAFEKTPLFAGKIQDDTLRTGLATFLVHKEGNLLKLKDTRTGNVYTVKRQYNLPERLIVDQGRAGDVPGRALFWQTLQDELFSM